MEETKYLFTVNGVSVEMSLEEVQGLIDRKEVEIIDLKKEINEAEEASKKNKETGDMWYDLYSKQVAKVEQLESDMKLIGEIVARLLK